MSEDIKAVFLGGGSEVGKLGLVLEIEDIRLLLDYGISPTKPPSYPMEAPPVDLALLTHAHLDHCEMRYPVPRGDILWERPSIVTTKTESLSPLTGCRKNKIIKNRRMYRCLFISSS